MEKKAMLNNYSGVCAFIGTKEHARNRKALHVPINFLVSVTQKLKHLSDAISGAVHQRLIYFLRVFKLPTVIDGLPLHGNIPEQNVQKLVSQSTFSRWTTSEACTRTIVASRLWLKEIRQNQKWEGQVLFTIEAGGNYARHRLERRQREGGANL